MTRKEESKMLRLELENKELRAQVENGMRIYREQLYEIVDMRIKLEMVYLAIGVDE